MGNKFPSGHLPER